MEVVQAFFVGLIVAVVSIFFFFTFVEKAVGRVFGVWIEPGFHPLVGGLVCSMLFVVGLLLVFIGSSILGVHLPWLTRMVN